MSVATLIKMYSSVFKMNKKMLLRFKKVLILPKVAPTLYWKVTNISHEEMWVINLFHLSTKRYQMLCINKFIWNTRQNQTKNYRTNLFPSISKGTYFVWLEIIIFEFHFVTFLVSTYVFIFISVFCRATVVYINSSKFDIIM